MPIRKDTKVTFLTAGGGGAGDPLQRTVEDVIRDVELGYVSAERAECDYGVVVTAAGEVERSATVKRQRQR